MEAIETVDPLEDLPCRISTNDLSAYLANLGKDELGGPHGEMVLAIALCDKRDAQKSAKALIKKSKEPRLVEALKLLPRRKYGSFCDLESIPLLQEAGSEVNIPQFAFSFHRFDQNANSTGYFSNVPTSYFRKWVDYVMSKTKYYSIDGERQALTGELAIDGDWPSDLWLPILEDVRDQIRVLKIGFSDEAMLPEFSDNLMSALIRGPVRGWERLNGLPNLVGLNVDGAIGLEGFASESLIGLSIKRAGSLPDFRGFSSLKQLTLESLQLTDAGDFSSLTSLGSLEISNCEFERLPGLGALQSLEKLEIFGTPIKELPPEIGQLSKLKELDLRALPLKTLPAELASIDLEVVRLWDMNFEALPEISGPGPGYLSTKRSTFQDERPGAMPPATAAWLRRPSLSAVVHDTKLLFDWHKEIPEIHAAYSDFVDSGDAASSGIFEAILALTRFCIDDDHGSQSNEYWCESLGKFVPPHLAKFHNALPKKQLQTQSALAAAQKQLATLEGIDADKFVAFAEAIMRNNKAKQLVPGK